MRWIHNLRLILKSISVHWPLLFYIIQKIITKLQRDLMDHYFPCAFILQCQGFRNIITLEVFFCCLKLSIGLYAYYFNRVWRMAPHMLHACFSCHRAIRFLHPAMLHFTAHTEILIFYNQTKSYDGRNENYYLSSTFTNVIPPQIGI